MSLLEGIQMPDFKLIPGRHVQEYYFTGDLHFRHEDEDHVAADVYIESDPHFPQHFAVQIITTDNKTITFDANSHGNWPPVAQRIYEQHRSMNRKGRYA